MKIRLSYDRPSQIKADLLVVIVDSEVPLHDLTGSPLDEVVHLPRPARVAAYYAPRRAGGVPGTPRNLLAYTVRTITDARFSPNSSAVCL